MQWQKVTFLTTVMAVAVMSAPQNQQMPAVQQVGYHSKINDSED